MYAYINGHFSGKSFSVFLSLSSCQLHNYILTIIKIRFYLCNLQVASHNILFIFTRLFKGTDQKIKSCKNAACGQVIRSMQVRQTCHLSEEQNAA